MEKQLPLILGALYTIVGLGLLVFGVVKDHTLAIGIGSTMAGVPGTLAGAKAAGKKMAPILLAALSVGVLTVGMVGCSSAEMLRNTDHSNEHLTTGGQSLNSQRVTYADGTSATYEGTGDPMVATSTDNGFDLVGEGTVGGATILIPTPDGDKTIFRILGQNDVKITGGEVTLADGSVAKAESFEILSSETRRARGEVLDRWTTIIATLTPGQIEAIQAERDKFIEAAGAISDVAAGVIANLIPVPTP